MFLCTVHIMSRTHGEMVTYFHKRDFDTRLWFRGKMICIAQNFGMENFCFVEVEGNSLRNINIFSYKKYFLGYLIL